jgi:hypothetical protein
MPLLRLPAADATTYRVTTESGSAYEIRQGSGEVVIEMPGVEPDGPHPLLTAIGVSVGVEGYLRWTDPCSRLGVRYALTATIVSIDRARASVGTADLEGQLALGR